MSESDYDRAFAVAIKEIWDAYQRRELTEVRRIQQGGLAAIFNSVIDRSRESPQAASDIDSHQAFLAVRQFFSSQQIRMGMSEEQFAASYDRDNVLRGVVGEILQVERQILEAQEPVRMIEEVVSDLFIGNKVVDLSRGVEVRAGDRSVPLELLSSGEKQIIYILLETIATQSDCIIIDEPELSMHVDWQRRLISTMRLINPKAQIIVATHSPEIMADVEERCIFEL